MAASGHQAHRDHRAHRAQEIIAPRVFIGRIVRRRSETLPV
jgi:hypothetical protein